MTTSRRLSPPRQSPALRSPTSTPNIRKMAAVAPQPSMIRSPTHFRLGSESLSTLRDPRSENDLRGAAAARETSPHPDLNLEVAALSNKLISAINHQTYLDDALASSREEVRQITERMRQAEARNAEYEKQMADGVWVRREEVDERTTELFRKFSVEKRARELADREKRAIESELADLSTKLFEEANQLVVTARKETEAAENRTEQVRAQLAETESLLASQQEQLVQLKAILEQTANQDDKDTTHLSTAPSTPAITHGGFDYAHGPDTPQSVLLDRPDPAPALHFTHLVAPILRNDVPAFEDFRGLVDINRKISSSTPGSRVGSGTYTSLTTGNNAQSSPQAAAGGAPAIAANSLAATASSATASQSHSPSQSTNSAASGLSLYSPTFFPPLRETKFFKRALSEDIDPTLRLDCAPGLSFFARRSVTAAINDNTLILEPAPSSSKKLITSCTLCGERRRGDEHARTHRFKAGEESTQWYPLCSYCVARLRSTCDYIGFLRMVRDGFWRCEGDKGAEKAWEESVRLRERMFWARIGGGVVPSVTMSGREDSFESKMASKRPSIDVGKRRSKEMSKANGDDSKSEVHTPPQSAKEEFHSSPPHDQASSEDEIPEIRELPSTAPPLQASSAEVSPTAVMHPRNPPVANGAAAATSSANSSAGTESYGMSIASSLRRISLRDLRFGSSSRNASVERGAGASAPGSPRIGTVSGMRAVYESKEEEKPAEEKSQEKCDENERGRSQAEQGVTAEKVDAQPKESEEKTAEETAPSPNSERPESIGLNISLPGGFD